MRNGTVKYLTLAAAIVITVTMTTPSPATTTCGDADDNGVVSVSDALQVLQAAVNGADCEVWLCDTNDDGAFSVTDVLLTLQRSVDEKVKLFCAEGVNPGDINDGQFNIINDDNTLDAEVVVQAEDVEIVDADPGSAFVFGNMGSPPAEPVLTLVAEVTPPQLDGQTLQAVSAHRYGYNDDFLVSYMMVGAPYKGCVDYISMRTPSNPRLRSRVTFSDADAINVTSRGSRVYVAQASDDVALSSPAALERVRLFGPWFINWGRARIDLTSFAGTSVTVNGNSIVTTSGNTGHLASVGYSSLAADRTPVALDDLRWAEVYDDKIVTVQGTPGRLAVFNADDFSLVASYPFAGADVPEAKSAVDVVGGKAFIAAGSAGVQVLSINSGQVLGSLATPSVAGLDPSVVVTNAVAASGDLVFMSNGEGGVFVARADHDFESSGSETPVTLTMLGQLQFGQLESVNHVEYNGDFLVVTAGLGGVKVVTVNDD